MPGTWLGRREGGLALLALCATQFMVVLDVTIVNVALPSIDADLRLGSALQWVVGAYALAFGGLLLVGGRAADALGRRRAFALGLVAFTAASLLAAVAWSPAVLLAARAAQGVGAALLSPAAMALLVTRFPEGTGRTRALAIWSSVGASAAATGVLVGGVLAELLSWRWIFLANVPLGLLILAAVPALPAVARGTARPSLRAALLGTAALVALVHALGRVGDGEVLEPSLAAAAGLALAACFVRGERRAAQPLVPRAVRGSRVRGAALAVGFVHGGTMLGMYLLLPLALQHALGYSPIQAGLGLLALRGSSIVWARVARRAIDRLGPVRVVGLGAALMTGGLLLLLRVDATSGYAGDVLPPLLVLGLAIPCLFVGVSVVVMRGVPAEHAGSASGLLTASQWTGGAVGLALVTAAAAAGAGPMVDAVASFRAGVLACAGLGVVGLLLGLVLGAAERRAAVLSPSPA